MESATEQPGAFHDFRSASTAVLEYLHQRLGFDLWMITRVEGEEWIILQVDDHGYGVKPGTIFHWADSFCYEMVKGNGPHIAPRTDCVKVYADAPIGRAVKIGSYIGYPLLREDRSVFGTLCAVHPAAQPSQIVSEGPQIELLSRLLSTILIAELKTLDSARRDERTAALKYTDPVTDLFDARGWEQLLTAEEERCMRYGNPACAMAVDVGPAYEEARSRSEKDIDDLLRATAGCVSAATRANDIVARVGQSTFGLLAVECDRAGAQALIRRLNESLAEERLNASIGLAFRSPPLLTLQHAWNAAAQAALGGQRSAS